VPWPVVGHEAAVAALSRAAEQGRLSHAHLFLGPKGVGKMALALGLAQALNCTGTAPPCGTCAQCRRTAAGRHADVHVVALPKSTDGLARKTIPIDAIKEMQQAAGLQPYEGRCRVIIIDGADALSPDAANRLLKTLEEPPPAVRLILLAANETPLLPTILSRCQTLQLRPVPRAKIEQQLVTACGVPAEQATLLAALANGSIGWAIDAARNEDLLDVRRSYMDQIAALPSLPYHDRLETARVLAEEFARRREDGQAWIGLLRQFWRDVTLAKGGQAGAVVNADRLEALSAMAEALSFLEIADTVRHINQAGERMEANANARLALDVLMLNVPVIPAKAERSGG